MLFDYSICGDSSVTKIVILYCEQVIVDDSSVTKTVILYCEQVLVDDSSVTNTCSVFFFFLNLDEWRLNIYFL